MAFTTEFNAKELTRLDINKEDVEAYLTYQHGLDVFTIEQQRDHYIVIAPGRMELVRSKPCHISS